MGDPDRGRRRAAGGRGHRQPHHRRARVQGAGLPACRRLRAGGPVARRQLGVITGFGLAVSGPVADDAGTANITFDVHGSWRNGHVRISAVKQGSDWVITNGVLKVDGQRYRCHARRRARLPPAGWADRAAPGRAARRLPAAGVRACDGRGRHRRFRDLPDELREGDLVVVNDTRVLPVRVRARRASGGAVEVLLLEPRRGTAGRRWRARTAGCARASGAGRRRCA